MLVLSKVTMELSNVRKNKGITQYDKSTVICDISSIQYEDETIKYDVLVTCYSRFTTCGYCTAPPPPNKKKKGNSRITPYLY